MTMVTASTTTASVRTVALCAAAAVLLYLSGIFVLFTPLPLIYAFLARGTRVGIVAAGAAMLLTVLLCLAVMPVLARGGGESWFIVAMPGGGFVEAFSLGLSQAFGIAYFIFFAIVACAIGEGALRTMSFSRWIGTAVAAGIGAVAFMAAAAELLSDGSLIAGMSGYFESVIAEIVQINQASGLSGTQIDYLSRNSAELAQTLTVLMPAIIFVFVMLVVVLNALMGRRLARVPKQATRAKQAAAFRLPDHAVWIMIAVGSMFFIDQYVLRTGWLKTVALNGIIIMSAVYFFQGFAVAAFFIERIRARFVRLIVYVMIAIFFQTIGIVMVGVGLADVWIHFRQRIRLETGSRG